MLVEDVSVVVSPRRYQFPPVRIPTDSGPELVDVHVAQFRVSVTVGAQRYSVERFLSQDDRLSTLERLLALACAEVIKRVKEGAK